MVDITLAKVKYRNPNRRLIKRNYDPPEGTWTFNGGGYKSKTSNSGTASKVKTIVSRRKAYGPW